MAQPTVIPGTKLLILVGDGGANGLTPPTLQTVTTSTTGGTLAAANYAYEVTALSATGESLASNQLTILTSGTTSSNTLTWGAVVGAVGYRIYRGPAATGVNVYKDVGNVTTFVDTEQSAGWIPGTPPTSVVEIFAQPCGLTTTGFNLSAATNETAIPDCDDPEAPAWSAKDITTLSAQVTGSGVMAVESFDVWQQWFTDIEPRNVQIKLDHPDLGHWEGQFILSSLQYSGTRGNKVQIDITLDNTGAVTWIPNP